MSREMVPYTFGNGVLPQSSGEALPAGTYQGVHFTLEGPIGPLLEKIEAWFEDRDEVILVAHGVTVRGLGYIIMEWEECEIDPLFLAILDHEDIIDDYSVYNRDEEG